MKLIMKIILSLIFLNSVVQAKSIEPSVYDIKTKWTNTDNQETQIDFLKGHNVLITMVYTSCPHACPMIIQKIQNLNSELESAGYKDVKIILASFDSKNDTPKALKKYQESRKLDPKKWYFLSAKTDQIARELSVVLNISYKDLGDGDFSHSNVITLLDKEGRILKSVNNLNFDSSEFLNALGGKK